MQITSDQLRAARALLHLDQSEVAGRARVSVITIRRLEGAGASMAVTPATLSRVRTALEQAGAEFIPNGVRKRAGRPGASSLFEDLREISLRGSMRLKDENMLTDSDLYDEDGLPL